MPWHPFPLFSLIFSFLKSQRSVTSGVTVPRLRQLPTHVYVPTELGVLCLPGHFVWPWEPFSGDWCCPLRMSVGQRTQIHDKLPTHAATQLKTGGWTEMSGEAESSKEMSPLLWGRPALPPRGCAICCKKKERKKERKWEADERGRKSRRKKIKEGESREGSWGRRQRGEEGDVKKSSSISSWRAYNAPSSRFYIYYLF